MFKDNSKALQESIVLILIGAMNSDKIVKPEEHLLLRQIISKSILFQNNSSEQDEEIINQAQEKYKENPAFILKAIDKIKTNPLKIASCVIVMVCEILCVDSKLKKVEIRYVKDLANALTVDEKIVEQSLNVFKRMYLF